VSAGLLAGKRPADLHSRRLRIAALYSHPVQYAAPLFRELSRRKEIDLTVYYLSRHGVEPSLDPSFGCTFQWDVPLLDGYKSCFVPNFRKGTGLIGFFSLMNFGIFSEILRGKYDVLFVHGYEHLSKWLAFAAAKIAGAKLVFHGESHLTEPRGLVRRAFKQIVLRGLFSQFDMVAYIGTMNRQYYEAYGVEAGRLEWAPYSVDKRFFKQNGPNAEAGRQELREKYGIANGDPVILYSGKLIDVKQPELVLRAFAEVRKTHRCHLVYVGDGVLRGRIEAQTKAHDIPDVHITGFINQSLMPAMLAIGDIFVLPSWREPWGLAVNEAMSVGLPVVVSDRVGCSPDLVKDGWNGFIFRHDDACQLSDLLLRLVAQPALREAFGRRSRELIEGWSIERTADGIVRAVAGAAGKEV
jgi:glycosyltransferase involved in cell wall biosynthesis